MQRQGHVPSRWDSPPPSTGAQAESEASRRAVPRNLNIASGMSDDEKRAELSRFISICSKFATPQSSQVDVASQSNTTPDYDEYKRPNPFPLEMGRRPKEVVTRKPFSHSPFSTRDSLIPPMPPSNVGAPTLASLLSNADELRQRIMLAGVNALGLNTTLNAQLLLGENNAINVNPSAISNQPQTSAILERNLTSLVPNGTGIKKYPAPDIGSFTFDCNTRYRFDRSTGLHYDANSGLFVNLARGLFLRWDPLLSTYLRVDVSDYLPHSGGPRAPPISNVVPSALLGPVKAPASALNIPPSSHDQSMNEIWQRMRELARDVIGEKHVAQISEEAVQTSSSKGLLHEYDSEDSENEERSRSSSSTTSGSLSCRSNRKDNKKFGRKSSHERSLRRDRRGRRSPQGRYEALDQKIGRTRRRSLSRSHDLWERRSRSRDKRRISSRSSDVRGRSRSRGKRRSFSRSPDLRGRRSRSRDKRRISSRSPDLRGRSRSRGKRRSFSRSPDLRGRRSRSRGKRGSFSRSPDLRGRSNRSRSRGEKRRLSRSPDLRERIKQRRGKKRSFSRSPDLWVRINRSRSRGEKRHLSRSLDLRERINQRRRERASFSQSSDLRGRTDRSQSRGKRGSFSGSPDLKGRSPSFSRLTERSRSRNIKGHGSTKGRSTSRSVDRQRRGRRSRDHSLLPSSRSPPERNTRSRRLSRGRKAAIREQKSADSTERRDFDSPNSEEKSSLDTPSTRKNARLENERAGSSDRKCLMLPIADPSPPIESLNENDRQDDSDGLSEFEFLKETLDDDNESVIVDEYEEILEYDYPEDKVTGSPQKPPTPPDPNVLDIGDVLGDLFPNDHQKQNRIIVAPVPLKNNSWNCNVVKSQFRQWHQDILSARICHGGGYGSPCHYVMLKFKTVEAASKWYASQNGSVILSDGEGSQMKAYLHFTEHIDWVCEYCFRQNFSMRDLCCNCYRAKNNGFSPVRVSKEPTKWVGLNKLRSCHSTTESVLASLPSLEKFNVQSIQMIFEPKGTSLGLCSFEVQCEAEAMSLGKLLSKRAKSWVYLIFNEKPAIVCDNNKNTDVEKVSGGSMDGVSMDDPIFECTPGNETNTEDSVADKDKGIDYLGPLFAENKPTSTLLLAPLKFSNDPKLLKSEVDIVGRTLQTTLDSGGLTSTQITIHFYKKVGAPCSYVLIHFPDPATAEDWHAKHNGTIAMLLKREMQISELYVHFSEGNWSCRKCHSSNFPFRSICHHCVNHKEESKSDMFTHSSITTKLVFTPSLYKGTNWSQGDGCIASDWKHYLKDFKLGIYVLRDPKCPVFPQGCLFETEGWGESLRLSELLRRTGRTAVFAASKSEFTKAIPFCPTDDVSATEMDRPMDCILGANSSSTESETSHLPESHAQELKPNKSLLWWGNWALYSELLNHLFRENPLTRVTDSQTVFVGPLPPTIKLQGLLKIITCKLQLHKIPFTTITVHAGITVGAPCNYALVNCETPQEAKIFISKFSDGFVLVSDHMKVHKLVERKRDAFKTHLYLCKSNWRCSSCSSINICLRSICWTCLTVCNESSPVLTFTSIPTNCVCIQRYQKSSATEELLLAEFPSLKSRCTIKYLKEESGIPLGVCMLETFDPIEAQKLFAYMCMTKRRKDVCYGILKRAIGLGSVGEGNGEPFGKQLQSQSEDKSELLDLPLKIVATEQVRHGDDSGPSKGCSETAKMNEAGSAQPKDLDDSVIIAESLNKDCTSPQTLKNSTTPQGNILDTELVDGQPSKYHLPVIFQDLIESDKKLDPCSSLIDASATEEKPVDHGEESDSSAGRSQANVALDAVRIEKMPPDEGGTDLSHEDDTVLSGRSEKNAADMDGRCSHQPQTLTGVESNSQQDPDTRNDVSTREDLENHNPSENLILVECRDELEQGDSTGETMTAEKVPAKNEEPDAYSSRESGEEATAVVGDSIHNELIVPESSSQKSPSSLDTEEKSTELEDSRDQDLHPTDPGSPVLQGFEDSVRSESPHNSDTAE